MEPEIRSTLLIAAFAFFLILFLTRFMGRKTISQMTFFNFATSITIGSMTGNLAIKPAKESLHITIALITIVLLTIIVDYIHIKSFRARKLFEPEPIVIIQNGKIINQNMSKLRLSIEDLNTLLREKNFFNIGEVEFAILENDGKLSVLPKSQKKPLTPADLKVPTHYTGLTKDIIIDGKIMMENLADAKLTEEWLMDQLNKKEVAAPDKVFYAGLDTFGNLYVSIKQHTVEKDGQYGME